MFNILFCIYRDGRLQVGDEIVNIEGKRLRGLRLERARQLLSTCRNVADAVISRTAGETPQLAAAAAHAATIDRLKQEEDSGGDLIHLTSAVVEEGDEEEEEVVRPTIITIGGEVKEVEEMMEEKEVDEVEEYHSGHTVELVHTTVDTPQVQTV